MQHPLDDCCQSFAAMLIDMSPTARMEKDLHATERGHIAVCIRHGFSNELRPFFVMTGR
jgi:hypothetical protein